jgi:hypothetical protein
MPLKTNAMRCKSPADFGELTFVINGFDYTLPNDDWVEKNVEYDQKKYLNVPSKYKNNFFKLYNSDEYIYNNKGYNTTDDEKGVQVSSLLHIEVPRLSDLVYGLKATRKIIIIDDEGKDCSDERMNVKKVKVYDSDKKLIEIGRYENRLKIRRDGISSYEIFGGGGKVSAKKEINGKLRCIYKIPGSRKEHIRYKGKLITVAEYKKIKKA